MVKVNLHTLVFNEANMSENAREIKFFQDQGIIWQFYDMPGKDLSSFQFVMHLPENWLGH